jgi:hypothetical protein
MSGGRQQGYSRGEITSRWQTGDTNQDQRAAGGGGGGGGDDREYHRGGGRDMRREFDAPPFAGRGGSAHRPDDRRQDAAYDRPPPQMDYDTPYRGGDAAGRGGGRPSSSYHYEDNYREHGIPPPRNAMPYVDRARMDGTHRGDSRDRLDGMRPQLQQIGRPHHFEERGPGRPPYRDDPHQRSVHASGNALAYAPQSRRYEDEFMGDIRNGRADESGEYGLRGRGPVDEHRHQQMHRQVPPDDARFYRDVGVMRNNPPHQMYASASGGGYRDGSMNDRGGGGGAGAPYSAAAPHRHQADDNTPRGGEMQQHRATLGNSRNGGGGVAVVDPQQGGGSGGGGDGFDRQLSARRGYTGPGGGSGAGRGGSGYGSSNSRPRLEEHQQSRALDNQLYQDDPYSAKRARLNDSRF